LKKKKNTTDLGGKERVATQPMKSEGEIEKKISTLLGLTKKSADIFRGKKQKSIINQKRGR